ncbi:hypothetical protein HHE03_05160 [Helicobacter heilmannii]|nr:hypothetical protein HHE03_05160 [Helicobacter heilmannii]
MAGACFRAQRYPCQRICRKAFGEGKIFNAYGALMDAFINNKQSTQEAALCAIHTDGNGTLWRLWPKPQLQP